MLNFDRFNFVQPNFDLYRRDNTLTKIKGCREFALPQMVVCSIVGGDKKGENDAANKARSF